MTINNIVTFVQKNKTPCRIFWGFTFTLYFALGWNSFYYTKTCQTYITSISTTYKSNITTILSTYVVIGIGLYALLVLVLPLVFYLIHQAVKETIEKVKRKWGTELVFAMYKFLVSIVFPLSSLWVSTFLDKAGLWTFIGLFGSVYCLFMAYVNPEDYGWSYGLYAVAMAAFLNAENIYVRCVLAVIVCCSWTLSGESLEKDDDTRAHEVLKPSVKSADNSLSVNDSQMEKCIKELSSPLLRKVATQTQFQDDY